MRTDSQLKGRLSRFRAEILLALSILLPVMIPGAFGLGSVLSAPLSLLPAVSARPDGDESGWRETSYRLALELADARERLFALGKPLELVPLDSTFYERNPVRIEARVLGRDASPWRGSVTISAGAREGVAVGQAVVCGNSLAGVVSESGRLISRVRLLVDPGHRVWAEIAPADGPPRGGYVVGSGTGVLEMRLVRSGAGKTGDPVFTGTGLEGVPRGLLVGAIQEIDDADRDGIAEISVTPEAGRGRLRVVNVLAPKRP